ncbi:MAG: glutamate-5-semialdehyde dehydrogenase, partial [Intestinibacillus sp.]
GLKIGAKRVPMGVIGIINEARPNVTVDAAALCFKAGSASLLRGGKEAFYSSKCLSDLMRAALKSEGLPENAINFVEDTTRESANAMMKLNGYLDVLIPRGGAGLIQAVVKNATVPVIETGTGNCHVYVDASADLAMAQAITVNAKCSRPSVCNAAESLLVHASVAEAFLPMAAKGMAAYGVKLHGCERTRAILGDSVLPATEEDYAKEYLDFEMSVKVVDSLDEAITHINKYNTGHSEAIVTESYTASQRFLDEVDAAAVYVNASTRFTDGFEFGFGAEIGISTQKLHARGPMGLIALTSTKYIIFGDGQTR